MEKQTIGGFLATLRKANGYTQQEVAEKIGVSNKTLSSWETDKTCPDLTLIPVLADLYGVTSDEILRAGRRRSETAEKEQAPEERAALNEKNIRAVLKKQSRSFRNRNYVLRGVSVAVWILLAAAVLFWLYVSMAAAIVFAVLFGAGMVTLIILLHIFSDNVLGFVSDSGENGEKIEDVAAYKLDVYRERYRTIAAFSLPFGIIPVGLTVVCWVAWIAGGWDSVSGILALLAILGIWITALAAFGIFRAYRNRIEKYLLSEKEKSLFSFHGKLLKKCMISGAWASAVVAVLFVMVSAFPSLFIWRDELYSAEKEDFRRYVQTVELPTGYHYPSEMPKGEYYFDIAAAVKELSENNKKTEIELENGFFLSGTAAERNSQDGLMTYENLSLCWKDEKDSQVEMDYYIVQNIVYAEKADAFLLRYASYEASDLFVREKKGVYTVGTQTTLARGLRMAICFLGFLPVPVCFSVYCIKRRR
ncbi:MAG: helix-turn-helix transcriptional regulator [Firmicutes bacterium]|nr:helix-turn-helix transcriptional regulator [Clostridia bacterium]MBS5022812.1 helix-turn-helix transcriptional regulator [Bacillota bacterium]